MNYLLFIFSIIFFTACASPKPNENLYKKAPSWLSEETLLDTKFVIGYAEPTFQGIYMQRQNALFDAKKKLSFNIKSIISSEKIENINVYKKNISVESIKNIDAFSELVLNDITQYDAYINENNELFLLVGLSNQFMQLEDKTHKLKNIDKNSLQESKCYNRDILNSISTKSLLYDDKPIWFYHANKKGFYYSIGIAEKVDENFEAQKKVALMLAKADLSKQIKSYSSSKMELMEMLKHEQIGVLLDSSSIHKSVAKINSIEIKDIWIDPKTCELYILIYSTK